MTVPVVTLRYRNGIAYNDVVEDTDNSDGREFLQIGGWTTDISTAHSTDADFDSIRVYSRALGAYMCCRLSCLSRLGKF